MGLKDKLKCLEPAAEGGLVEIPQQDGTVKRFPPADLEAAFINECSRLRGEDLPVHPLTLAARHSSEARWRNSALAEMHVASEEVEDLSE